MADRFVLLVGKGELYRALARLAQLHLDDERAIGLLQRAVSTTPNNAAAHRALGRAYVENGRETEGYAELVIALLLDPNDVETLTELGRLASDGGPKERRQGVPADAVEALERAVAIDPANRLAVRALADALIRAGRTTEGKQRLEESERLQARAIEDDRRAKTAAVLRLNAEIRRGERDYAGAIDLWRQAISLQRGKRRRPSPARGGTRRGEAHGRGGGRVSHGDFTQGRSRRSSSARGAVRRSGAHGRWLPVSARPMSTGDCRNCASVPTRARLGSRLRARRLHRFSRPSAAVPSRPSGRPPYFLLFSQHRIRVQPGGPPGRQDAGQEHGRCKQRRRSAQRRDIDSGDTEHLRLNDEPGRDRPQGLRERNRSSRRPGPAAGPSRRRGRPAHPAPSEPRSPARASRRYRRSLRTGRRWRAGAPRCPARPPPSPARGGSGTACPSESSGPEWPVPGWALEDRSAPRARGSPVPGRPAGPSERT